MKPSIAIGYQEETLEAKARWFQGLTIQERLDVFSDFMDLALALNPSLLDFADVQSVPGRVEVLKRASSKIRRHRRSRGDRTRRSA